MFVWSVGSTLYCFGVEGGCGDVVDVVDVVASCRCSQEGEVRGLRDTVSVLLKKIQLVLDVGKIPAVA